MKKISVILLIMFLFTLFFPGAVLAEKKSPIIKGDVISFDKDEGTILISTEEGDIVVHVPPNFNFNNISIGSQVLAKVQQSQNGSVVADWIKEVNKGDDDLEIEEDGEEIEEKEGLEGKFNSSYCSGEKENDHPFAAAIAETYGTLVSDVMKYFCNGYGFGEIMLALQTHQVNGEEIVSMLVDRKSGHGWGQIWQEMDMIGNPDKAKSPPGQLKKSDQTDIE